MASIVVSGDTSGAITIAAPAVAGTNTLTLPASTGTLVVTGGAQTIEFAAGTVSAPSITTTGDTNTGIFFPAADTIAFTEGGVEAMRIDSSGRVGIGTTSPAFKTEIVGGADTVETTLFQIRSNAGGINTGTTIALANSTNATAGSGRVELAGLRDTSSGSSFVVRTADSGGTVTERMRITSDGNLLVGTTNSSLTAGQGFKAIYNGGTDPYVGAVMASSSNSQTNYHLYSTGAGTFRFYVGMGGTISATSATITTISDQRLKENIVDIDVGLDAVMALKPRKFDWKAGKGKDKKGDRGWIAQEFETVFPEMIQTWKDPAPEGEEPYKAVNADLIPVLVKAIQEQQQIINDLKARIETLEGAK